jgi:hypothetical protein
MAIVFIMIKYTNYNNLIIKLNESFYEKLSTGERKVRIIPVPLALGPQP